MINKEKRLRTGRERSRLHALGSSEMSALDFSHGRNVASGELFRSIHEHGKTISDPSGFAEIIPLSISNQGRTRAPKAKSAVAESDSINDNDSARFS